MVDGKQPKRILIVDDMRTVRMLLPAYFVGKNYVFLQAESGEEALERLSEFHPDLLITDVNMEGMDGPTLCAELRQQAAFAALPVILITSEQGRDHLAELDPKCRAALIHKPLDPKEVRTVVEDFLNEGS